MRLLAWLATLLCAFVVFLSVLFSPVRAFADVLSPSLVSYSYEYPKLDLGFIPNTLTYPHQSAFKDGDQTYVYIDVASLFPITSATLDASVVGAGLLPAQETSVSGSTHSFQAGPLIISSHGVTGPTTLLFTVATQNGTSTLSLPLTLDNARPLVLVSDATVATTSTTTSSSAASGILTLSGMLDGTGTVAHLFSIFVQFVDAAGLPIEHGLEYYGLLEATALRALGNGPFSKQSIPLFETPDQYAAAAAAQLSLLVKDDAGNIGTTTALIPFGANNLLFGSIASSSDQSGTLASSTATSSSIALLPGVHSSVLFLPGIETSRLYVSVDSACDPRTNTCPERKAWEPADNASLDDLALTAEGSSVHVVYAKEGDVMETAQDPHLPFVSKSLYARLFQTLTDLKHSGSILDWRPIAYDWRLSLDDLTTKGSLHGNKIFYEEATDTPYIEQTLRELAAHSATGKVTIIAHSNGGLVAKALLEKLGPEAAQLVDTVVLVAAPQSGAATDVALLLYGYGGALPLDSCASVPILSSWCSNLISRAAARTFAEHAPLAYHLLPSASYFRQKAGRAPSLIEFNSADAYARERSVYGSSINSVSDLANFLQANDGGRIRPAEDDLSHANVLTASNLIAYASTTHAALDAWTPPAGIETYQIAGTGDDTLSGIEYYDHAQADAVGVHARYRPLFTQEGDGTVETKSALQIRKSAHVHKLWFSLRGASSLLTHYDHSTVFEAPELTALLTDVILGNPLSLAPVFSTVRPPASSFADRIVLVLHSPLSLEATNAAGNTSGIASDGTYENGIAGATYGEFGDLKYLILPAAAYQVVLHGQGSGVFDLDVMEMSQNMVVHTTSFDEVPVSERAIAHLSIGPGSISPLTVDPDGTGKNNFSFAAPYGTAAIFNAPADSSSTDVSLPTPPSPVPTDTSLSTNMGAATFTENWTAGGGMNGNGASRAREADTNGVAATTRTYETPYLNEISDEVQPYTLQTPYTRSTNAFDTVATSTTASTTPQLTRAQLLELLAKIRTQLEALLQKVLAMQKKKPIPARTHASVRHGRGKRKGVAPQAVPHRMSRRCSRTGAAASLPCRP